MKNGITFGGKPTMRDKTKAVVDRLGKTTGDSKGSPAPSKWKVRPKGSLSKGKVGVQATKKF